MPSQLQRLRKLTANVIGDSVSLEDRKRGVRFAPGIGNMTHSAPEASVDVNAIKEVIGEHIGVPFDAENFEPDGDLYAAGLTSLATVGLMLALEDRFDVEFPESMLGRSTFRSVAAIADVLAKLTR